MTKVIRYLNFSKWPNGQKAILCLLLWIGYVGLYLFLFQFTAASTSPLAVLPLAATAWAFGHRIGTLAGVLAASLNPLLFNICATGPWRLSVHWVPSGLILVLVGTTVGWLHELFKKTKEQALDLARERARLKVQIDKMQSAEHALQETQEQLLQSQKMQAIGRLAGGIAHDFNNLLTVINGYSQLGLKHLESDQLVRSGLEQILDAGLRASNLTRQLLAFSRKQVLQTKELDLSSLVAGMKNMITRILGEDIQVITSFDQELGAITADPGQIEQVILNLIINARDAMPHGGQILIKTAKLFKNDSSRKSSPLGSCVMLEVTDTGCGMDAETQSHIFEPFFTSKGPAMGTGLGLSTVYGIVKQSGGDIEVSSAPGDGASFRIYLPSAMARFEGQSSTDTDDETRAGVETILVVEDENSVLDFVSSTLSYCGYKILRANCAKEARILVRHCSEPIDLLLTDLVMPGIDGFHLSKQLRTMRPSIRVLYMSGYPTDSFVNRQIDPGDNFIAKPFTPAGLTRKIREVLSLPEAG